jgi:hypothetical protein
MISKEFAAKFENAYRFCLHTFLPRKWYFSWLDLSVQKILFCPSIHKSDELFANDHLWSSPKIIGKHDYMLLEDSAGICSNYWFGQIRLNMEENRKSKSYKIRKMLFGPVEVHPHGSNECCTDLLLTTDDSPEYIRGKKIHRINWFNLWDSFSEWKKKFIMDVYDFSSEDICFIKSKKIILFTQPLFPDLIPAEEHERIYCSIIKKYPIEDLLVKPHPRDTFPYEQLDEKLMVFRKRFPSQIFDMAGIKFEKAITVFSSAVKSFEYPVSVDWYGTECSKLLFEKRGHVPPPKDVCLKTI